MPPMLGRFLPRLAGAAVLGAFGLAAVALAADNYPTFNDVPPGHWARVSTGVLAARNVFPGRTPVNFAGDATLTRYELAHVVSALYAVSEPPSTFIALRDVPPGHVATLDVQRVLGYGLMDLKGTVFGGDRPVTMQEFVTALDTLFAKNGISPPARQASPVLFSDVPAGSPLGQVLDRIVNRFRLLQAEPFSRFNPGNAVTRYNALKMVLRALPYLNPALQAEIREAAKPAPTPTPSSEHVFARPTPTPALRPSPTPRPSGAPDAAGGPQLLPNRFGAGLSVLAVSDESLPTDAGAIASGEAALPTGYGLVGGTLGGEGWSGPWGFRGSASAYYLPLTLQAGGKSYNEDMADLFGRGAVLYMVGDSPDFQLAAGGGLLLRQTFNVTGQIVNLTYLSADKTYVGAGPATEFGVRLSPELTFTGGGTLYPYVMQHYFLNGQELSLGRWGLDLDGALRYDLGQFFLTGGAQAFVSGGFSGGLQSQLGLNAGAGLRF